MKSNNQYYREIIARFNSECSGCHMQIKKGDIIHWKKGSPVLCKKCFNPNLNNIYSVDPFDDMVMASGHY